MNIGQIAERRTLSRLMATLERFLSRGEDDLAPDAATLSHCHTYRWVPKPHGGFRWVAVNHRDTIELGHLLGIDRVKQILTRNTQQFVQGHDANHALLWGSRGTGKSSLVKALGNRFGPQGLRLIEVQKEDLMHLPRLLGQIRPLPYRFILFCDDLSFEESEVSYKSLKAILEGGLEAKPENLLIYATSNRRHLMPKHFADQGPQVDDEMHPQERMEERISLSDRFGLWLGFHAFDQQTYLSVVSATSKRLQLAMDEKTLHQEALIWARTRGARSGRVAHQFMIDLKGRLACHETKDEKTP
ncbi:ATP-binding protein [Magnetococcus sp. PR-3]|uniref:ATP-binding protein n=1 Tax=Magnetococcus sp. PR-3 TaxID=3120355 RepID=UPI002FCE0140